MKKINLFYILAFEEQTAKFEDHINKLVSLSRKGKKLMKTTLELHFFLLTEYFDTFNFFKFKDRIKDFENPVIYHVPYGRDDRQTHVEECLTKWKGAVPIVMRSYDAHSPLKTSSEYMTRYHDLTLTYLRARVNHDNIREGHLCYDNHLISMAEDAGNKEHLICMVLRNRQTAGYYVKKEEFLDKNLDLQKMYHLRQDYIRLKDIHIYGTGWPKDLDNYCGTLTPHEEKYSMLKRYKFNLILENVIVDNYISEKIHDTFLALSVPVYLGSPVIAEYIPKSCFIDLREFEGAEELINYLKNMQESEYQAYIGNIKEHREQLFDRFSTKENLAKPLYGWYNEIFGTRLGLSDEEYDSTDKRLQGLQYTCDGSLAQRVLRNVKKTFLSNR